MRRAALAILSTIAGLVLLLTFKTSPASVDSTAAPRGAISPGGSGSTSSSSTTVTGDAADTRYGPVQVRITMSNGAVTAVEATEYPTHDRRDQEINSYAIPQLNEEATSARSADIDMVSGATYTSEGYISSLQSALDKAGLS